MLKLGNLELESQLLLAPIAGYCDLAFRLVVRPLGGLGLACTDLVNPRGVLRQTKKTLELLRTEREDRPLCVQLYGNEPNEMSEAARWCRDRLASVIDINMGCPAEKICKRSGGAALLRDPATAARVAAAVVKAVDIPVTAKLRLGWNRDSVVASTLAPALEDAGVAGITIHGRTAEDRFAGNVQLDEIARVVEAVRHIPVIGNGDVRTPQDARMMLDRTGCAGVMIGRGALRDPWIFRDTHAHLTGAPVPPPPTDRERIALMRQHFEYLMRYKGERLACALFRQRFSWYAGKLQAPKPFRDRIRQITTAQACREMLIAFPDEDMPGPSNGSAAGPIS